MCNNLNVRIGNHDNGKWDLENKVYAAKNPIAEDLTISEATEKAISSPGSELIVADLKTGKASIHKIFIEDAAEEEKSININEIVRDGVEQGKNYPLLIEDNVATQLGGNAAFLVDEKNKVTFLGNSPEKSDAGSRLHEAYEFVNLPTNPKKVDIANKIAKEIGSPEVIERKLVKNIISEISKTFPVDYKPEVISDAVNSLNYGSFERQDLKEIEHDLKELHGQYLNKLNSHNGTMQELFTQNKVSGLPEVNSKMSELYRLLRPDVLALESKISELQAQAKNKKYEIQQSAQPIFNLHMNINSLDRKIENENSRIISAGVEYIKSGKSVPDFEYEYLKSLEKERLQDKKELGKLEALPSELISINNQIRKVNADKDQLNAKPITVDKNTQTYFDTYNKLNNILNVQNKFNQDIEPFKQKAQDIIEGYN